MNGQNKIQEASLKWYAVYTRYRTEFAVERELTVKGVSTYLPTINSRREWKDRKKWISMPIFPSYLFVNVLSTFNNFAKVVNTRGVVTLLGPSEKKPTPVSDEEILSLMRFVDNYSELTVYSHLKTGKRVRIDRGPMKGFEGVIEREPDYKKNECWLFIRIELLGRSVGTKINADSVQFL